MSKLCLFEFENFFIDYKLKTMQKRFTLLTLLALFITCFSVNAQITPPYGTCGATSGAYEAPAGVETGEDGNPILYVDGSNSASFMQTPTGGSLPDNTYVFDAIDYEDGVPVDTFLVISDDYVFDLTDLVALGLDVGDVLHAYSITYDIATINTIATGVEAQCATLEILTGNDQVCEILAEIQAGGGFQSLEDAITLAGLFFGEIPSVSEAAFQLDTLNIILEQFGPLLGITDDLCFAYDGFETINIVTAPPSCDATATTLTNDDVTICLNSDETSVTAVTDGSEGDQQVTYVITDETGGTILGMSDSPTINFGASTATILDFESPSTTSNFQAFGGSIEGLMYGPVANPDPSGVNTSANVIMFNKAVGSADWSGGFANPAPTNEVDLTAGGEVCISVWMDAPRTVTIKLENSATNPNTWEQTVANNVINEWVEICFDSNALSTDGNGNIAAGHSFPTVVVFFNLLVPVGDTDEITYFDNITVVTPGAPPGVCLIWAVTHDGTLNAPTDQVADLEGCFALSNSVAVTREECVAGCMDASSCNYNPDALLDDGSCVYATGCDVCDGEGGVTDNPEAGESCDDGDATTENDVVQGDCSCAGTPIVTTCDLVLQVIEDCDEDAGVSAITLLVTGTTSTSATVNGTFNLELTVGEPLFVGTLSDTDTYSLTLSDDNGQCGETINGIVSCVKDETCDYSIEIIDECDTETGAYTFGFIVNSDSQTTANVTGSFTGEVNVGELNTMTLVDGDVWNLSVSLNDEECTSVDGVVSCVKDETCDYSIEIIDECDTATGAYTFGFIVNSDSQTTANVTGSFTGEVNVGELNTMTLVDGDVWNLSVSLNGEECTSVDGIVSCVKDEACDYSIEIIDECDTATGAYTFGFIVNSDSQTTANVTGSFTGEVNVGELNTMTLVDGDVWNLSVSLNGEECTSVDGVVSCVKDQTCDYNLVIEDECDTNTGVFTLAFTVESDTYATAEVSGTFNGTVNTNELIIAGSIADGDSWSLDVLLDDEVCVTASEQVSCIKDACPDPIVLTVDTICNDIAGEYTLTFIINGASGEYNLSGGLNMTVEADEFISAGPFANADVFTMTISDADGDCDDVIFSSSPECVKVSCDEPITAVVDTLCDTSTGEYTLQIVINGGSGAYNLSGSYNGGAAAGENIFAGPFADNETFIATISDADPESVCDDVTLEVTPNCVKAECEDPIVISSEINCVDNTPFYTVTFSVTGGTGVYDITGSFEGTINAGDVITTDAIAEDEGYSIIADDQDVTELCDTAVEIGELEEPCFIPNSIGDTVFEDTNGNGIQDEGEPGIAGVTITLTGPAGPQTTTTDENGNYIFEDLPDGTYTVTVGTGPDGTLITTDGSFEITVAGGEYNGTGDFGFQPIVCEDFDVFFEQICPQPADGTYDLQVFIFGGTEPYTLAGDFNGTIEGNEILVSNYEDGSPYSFLITDAFGCDTLITNETESCVKTDIELLTFDGFARETTNLLEWTTASEIENDYFIVERSANGVTFEEIGHVNGAGNSVSPIGYNLVDQTPIAGLNYYRLLTVDFDGNSKIASQIITIDRTTQLDIIHVDATGGDLVANINSNTAQAATITVYDAAGKLITNQKVELTGGLNNIVMNASAMSNGIYFLNVEAAGEQVSTKFVKQ